MKLAAGLVLAATFLAACAHAPEPDPLPQGSPTPFAYEPTPSYPPIEWVASLTEAKARATEEHKPLIVFVRAAWSKASVDMDQTIWADARVLAEAGRFIAVRVDLTGSYADGDPIPKYLAPFEVQSVPTTVVVDTNGRMTGHWGKGDAKAKDVGAVLKLTN